MEIIFPHHSTFVTRKEPSYESVGLLPYVGTTITEGSFGKLLHQETGGADFFVNLHILDIHQPIELTLSVSRSSVSLIYLLKGQISFADITMAEGSYCRQHAIPGSYPVWLTEGKHTIIYIEWLSPLPGKYLWQGISRINDRVWETLTRMLYCRLSETERKLYQHARVLDLLLLYSADIHEPADLRHNFSATDIRAVLDANALQKEHAGDAPGFRNIARKVNLHPKKLRAGFRFLFGRNAHQQNIETRMKMAKDLLITTERSLSEVAWETGYCNSSSFIRAFKQHTGVTPASYRNKHRGTCPPGAS